MRVHNLWRICSWVPEYNNVDRLNEKYSSWFYWAFEKDDEYIGGKEMMDEYFIFADLSGYL